MREHTVVFLVSVIVSAEDDKDAVRKAAIPFQLGLLPHMGKLSAVGVRETIDGDREPIVENG